jgi:predicted phosphodiesterase
MRSSAFPGIAVPQPFVSTGPIRIFSDLHYGDRASMLSSLPDLKPLLEGADQIILNGDTLDTRTGGNAAATSAARGAVTAFFHQQVPRTTWLTGNHDPDISENHAVELAGRKVYVTHGDILFENLVPWGRDAAALSERIAAELAQLSPVELGDLEKLFAASRRAAASIPQRHQTERNLLKYVVGFAADTFWPPLRILHVLKAWRETPVRAEALLKRHQLPARIFIMGHTHRLGVTRSPNGTLIINTGSFCPPCAGGVVDVTATHVLLRTVTRRAGEFRLGDTLADFALAQAEPAETLIT